MNDPVVAESNPNRDHQADRVDSERLQGPSSGGIGPGNWTVRYVAETGSTNADLVELARQGAPDRTVLRTDHQTAGRGRLDRRWTSPPGANLMVSLLFRPFESGDPTELVRRVSVAAVEAVDATTGRRPILKWPNDLLLAINPAVNPAGNGDERKLAGILAQRDDTIGAVVVGLGLNTSWSPEDAISLDAAVTPADLLDALLVAYDRLPQDGSEFHKIYRQNLATLGRRVRVELPTEQIVGRAVDVDAGGHLVVLDDCAITHHISVGDVIHLRLA